MGEYGSGVGVPLPDTHFKVLNDALGQLDGSIFRLRAPSWEDKYCQVPEPSQIPLPCRAEAISAGRNHLLVLDQDNLIWEFCAWGRVRQQALRSC